MKAESYIPKQEIHRALVHSFWQVNGHTQYREEMITPKGVIEVIFNFGSKFGAKINDQNLELPTCFINGYNQKPIVLRVPEEMHFFGIRLQPLAVKRILGAPGSEFLNQAVDLSLINQDISMLWERMLANPSFNYRVGLILKWLDKKHIQPGQQDMLIDQYLCSANANEVSVRGLANHIYYSPRHLTRKLTEATGLNAEEILLYKKYLRSVELIHKLPDSLSGITYESGFSDQSHFIKTFRQYTGMTPGEYRHQKSHRNGHIFKEGR